MANNVYTLAKECRSCALNGSLMTENRKLQLLQAAGPLKFVATDTVGPLPRTMTRNLYKRQVSKPGQTIPTAEIRSTQRATVFLNNSVMPYGIDLYLMPNNVPQLVSKCFTLLCFFLGVKNLNTTGNHSQANNQAARYNCTKDVRLRKYVSEEQRHWDTYLKPLMYA